MDGCDTEPHIHAIMGPTSVLSGEGGWWSKDPRILACGLLAVACKMEQQASSPSWGRRPDEGRQELGRRNAHSPRDSQAITVTG